MDATDLFSYQLTVSNGGVFPLWGVQWALAPREIKMSSGPSAKPVGLILPHSATWTATPELMALAMKPGKERHASLMFYPASHAWVTGDADYEFQIRSPNNKIGYLAPGDQFTFTTEGLISAPPDASYDVADFAVAIKYIPFLLPVQMQACSHFQIFKDRQGNTHWFRANDQCDLFPWVHGLLSKSNNQAKGPA
jgi:hypothetical protein